MVLCLVAAVLASLSPALAAAADDATEISAAAAPSTNRPWQWQSYAASVGLLRQRVFDIAFARDGIVWFAASNGLWRYDGYRWTVFGPDEGLPSRFVRAVAVTKSGELWVGTDAGAGVFDPANRSFDFRGTREALPNGNVRQIVEDTEGTLWFSCDQWPDTSIAPGGLAALRDGRWRVFTQAEGLPMNYVIGYHRDRAGHEFAFTPRGWVRRHGERWIVPAETGYDVDNTVLHLAEARDGRLFAQGEKASLTLGPDGGAGWRALPERTLLLGDTREGEVLALARDNERGSIWLARWNGAEFIPLSARVPGPRVPRLYHLREAPDGAIWCVGEGTILRWARDDGNWRHYARLPSPQSVDARDRVWFAGAQGVWWAEDGTPRRLDALAEFIGVDRDGLVLGRATDKTLVQIRNPNAPAPEPVRLGFTPAQATNDFEHRLWIWGPDALGQIRFSHRDAAGNWSESLAPDLKNRRMVGAQPDPRGGIDAVFLDPRNTGYTVAHISDGGISWIDLGSDPPPIPYPQFYRVGTVELIVGYDRVYQRDTAAPTEWSPVTELTAGAFTWALPTPTEAFLLFNGGKTGVPGCARFSGGRWQVAAGEFDSGSHSPDFRKLSVATRGGVYLRSEPGSLSFDYLPLPEETPIQSLLVTAGGELWISTSDGVLHHRPGAPPPETTVQAQVTEVGAHGLPVRFGGIARLHDSAPAESWRFSWRIDEGPWSGFAEGVERTLPVYRLAPGPHRLEVRARDAEAIDPEPARLDFTVLAVPLQERRWFPYALAGLALLIAGLLWLGIARSHAIRRSNAALRGEIKERQLAEAALRAAHDELEKRVAERTAELSSTNASLRRALDEHAATETQRIRLEHQLREAQKMQAIGTLAGGIAHDFNNILTIILPCAQFALEEAGASSSVAKHLKLVLQAANRAKLLVQQILAFSRRQPRAVDLIDLAPIVREAEAMLASSLPPGIRLSCTIAPDLPAVLADSTQLHQVLMNLCANAEHALRGRPDGRIAIGLDTLAADEDSALLDPELQAPVYVRLTVQDNGVGMPENVRRRVFEPFFTTKIPGQGTGLGLAVVHGVLREHHGLIRIESQPGAGTQVQVLLPAQASPAAPAQSPAATPPRGRGETVLLVDDIPDVLDSIGQLLRKGGYEVVAHERASTALAELHDTPDRFALLVTDLAMPGMSGLKLCQEVHRERPALPLLVITGFDGNVSPEELAAAGVGALVTKPVDPLVLFQRMRELLAARTA